MASLELSAHLTVRPGCLEGFKRQAAECIRITREKDTHTLRYDWFLSLDGTECVSFLQGLEPSAVIPQRDLAADREAKPPL